MLYHAIIKEFKLLLRDVHALAVLFVMPLAFVLIMSAALSRDQDPHSGIAVALVAMADNPVNKLFAQALQQEDMYVTQLPPEALTAAQSDLQQGKYVLLIDNPNPNSATPDKDVALRLFVRPDIDRARLAGIKGVLHRHYTETRLNHFFEATRDEKLKLPKRLPKKIRQEIQEKQQIQTRKNFDVVTQYLQKDDFEEIFIDDQGGQAQQPNSVQHSVPAWLIFGMFFIMIPLSNVMAMERETNTITRLRLARVGVLQLVLAKFVPYFLINQLQFVAMVLLGQYLLPKLGIPALVLSGALWHYALLSAAISLAALGYGLLVSVSAKSTEHAVVLGGGGIILMAAIGGIMVPSFVMPSVMQTIAQISPMAWALSAFQDLLLNRADLAKIGGCILQLLLFGIVCLLLAVMVYARQLKNKVKF